MRIGKQHWQKVVSLLKDFPTPRSKELARELSAVRSDYRELSLRTSALAGESDTACKDLEKVKQQIDSVHAELGAIYEARERLTLEFQKQLKVAGEAQRLREQELLADIKNLTQRTNEAERNELANRDQNQALAVELAGIQYEFETSRHGNSKQLADLELQLADIEAESARRREQLLAVENSLAEAASRHSDAQQRVKALEGTLERERKRHQAELSTVEEKLARVQIEQESLLNTQSGLADSLRTHRRWATAAAGIAFVIAVLAGVIKFRDIQKDAPEQAAVTDDPRSSLEPPLREQDKRPREAPVWLTGESVENAAFETGTTPKHITEPTGSEPPNSDTEAPGSEPLSKEQAGQIDKPEPSPGNDASKPLEHLLTPGQTLAMSHTNETKAFFEENAKREGVVSLPSGLQYKVLRTGQSRSPGPTDMVILHYRGSLPDGREFDSSYAENAPAAYRVDEVIAGWREALQRMQEGAQWELYIPPELADSAGKPETPGFLPLIYQIELIAVSKAETPH